MNNGNSLLFTVDEYSQRLEKVREHMRTRNVDVLLVDQTEFLFYLTGFGISENMYRACLVPLTGEPIMVLRAIDEDTFRSSSWLSQFVTFSDWENPIEVLADTIQTHGWHSCKIGIDEESYCMTLRRFHQLKALLPAAEFIDFSGVLEQVRARKSLREIDYIRRAALMADQATKEALLFVQPGKSGREVAELTHRVFIRHGGDSHRCGIFTAGSGNSFLHGNLQDSPLQTGDILHMEFLPYVHGYSARLMRPAVVGRPGAEQSRLAEQLISLQDKQFAAMRPGVQAQEVDAVLRDAVLTAGLRDDYINITGYSLGYYPLSTPRTSDFSRVFLPSSDWTLEAGMVFHMYASAFGLGFSETIAVTDTGVERLTLAPRSL